KALEARANEYHKDKFNKLDDELKEATAKYEDDGETDLIKDKRAHFITSYSDLELAAIKTANLGEARTMIDNATKDGARDLTPKTLAEANKTYKEAADYITQNRDDTAVITAKSAIALEAARK